MNKIFKRIWNKHRGCFVAVSELLSSASQNHGKTAIVLCSLLIANPINAYTLKHLKGSEPLDGTHGDYNTEWHGQGVATMSQEYYGAWVELCGYNSGHGIDELRITPSGIFHISNTFQHGKDWQERDIVLNNGLIDLVGDARYIYQHSAEDSLTGTGTINGGHLNFQKDKNITQGKITNFRSFVLSESGVVVNELTGSNLSLDGSSSLVVRNTSALTGLSNQGSISFNNLSLAGQTNNSGNISVTGLWSWSDGAKLNQTAGTTETQYANIFSSLGSEGPQELQYVSLNTPAPEEVKSELTEFFLEFVPGTVAESLANHASFTGGKVVVTGVNITQTQADALVEAFKSKFFNFHSF